MVSFGTSSWRKSSVTVPHATMILPSWAAEDLMILEMETGARLDREVKSWRRMIYGCSKHVGSLRSSTELGEWRTLLNLASVLRARNRYSYSGAQL